MRYIQLMQKTAAHAEVRDEVADLVAGNLSDHMEAERWTGRSFALALGLQPIYVQRRMSGEVELSATDLKVFADKLGIRVQDLFKSRTLVPKVAGSNPVGGTLIPFPARTIEPANDREAVILPFPGVA